MQYRSLFTAIPVDKACDNIHKNLLKDKTLSSRTSLDSNDIISLLNFVLSNNCFVYDDKIHCIQTDPWLRDGQPCQPCGCELVHGREGCFHR